MTHLPVILRVYVHARTNPDATSSSIFITRSGIQDFLSVKRVHEDYVLFSYESGICFRKIFQKYENLLRAIYRNFG